MEAKSILSLLLSAFTLNADKVTLHNHENKTALYVHVERPGALADKKQLLRPLEHFTYSVSGLGDLGKLNNITVLPANKDIKTLQELKDRVRRESKLTPRELGKASGLYLDLKPGENNVSFTYDSKNKPKLIEGKAGHPKPFSFLVISDTHPIAKSEKELQTMNLKHYGGNESREQHLEHHKAKVALRNRMLAHIQNPAKNIHAVIMPGDNAGGFGKKSDTEAYKAVWHNPLKNAFKMLGGNIYLGVGNHDCYWKSILEPPPTKMLRFIKEQHGAYLYSFYIGNVLFINLGLYPSLRPDQLAVNNKALELGNSIPLLIAMLRKNNVNKETPIVIFFHYPTQGSFSDWWAQDEKDAFYNVIKYYNVILIIVGHAHSNAIYKFRDKFPMVRAAGQEFAEIKFDPSKPHEADITFVDARGNSRIQHVENAPEKTLVEKPVPALVGGIDLSEHIQKAIEGKLTE